MHDIKKINVMEGILDENDHIAGHVNEHMTRQNHYTEEFSQTSGHQTICNRR